MSDFETILKKHLTGLKGKVIDNISKHGTKLSDKTKALIEIQTTVISGAIVVPFWFPIFEHGRGPKKNAVYAAGEMTVAGVKLKGLEVILYKWLQRHNKFKKKTERGRAYEARHMRWYMNKYGNKLYRDLKGSSLDIYSTLIPEAVNMIAEDISSIILLEFKSNLVKI
jgi:hypothetical protein